MPTTTTPATKTETELASIRERITSIRDDVSEIKTAQIYLVNTTTEFQRHYTGEHVRVEQSAIAAHGRIDKLEDQFSKFITRFEQLEKALELGSRERAILNQRVGVIMAILVFLGVTVGGYLLTEALKAISSLLRGGAL